MEPKKTPNSHVREQKQDCVLQTDGERFLPWMEDSIINYEHLHRYGFAKEFVKGKKVLDLACGEGYGSDMLAERAEEVIGVDISEAAIKHACYKYVRGNLKFVKSSAINISIKGEKIFDVIVCFEALEHIEEQDKVMKEVKRIIKDNGLFIVSTPNKYVYSDLSNCKNPWHKKELYLDEFKSVLKSSFNNVIIYGQKVFPASNIFSIFEGVNNTQELAIEKNKSEFSFVPLDKKEARYFIAVASDDPMEAMVGNSYLVDNSETPFRQIIEAELEAVRNKLEAIHSSHGWKLLKCYYKFRDKIFPPNTRIRAYTKRLWKIVK